jgi:hypothetical protein
MKKTLKRRKGNCAHCGNKPEPGKVNCRKCRLKYNHITKQYYKRWKKQGLCQKCGRPKKVKGLTVCQRCRLKVVLTGCRQKGMSESEIQKAKTALLNFNGICQGCKGINKKCKGSKNWGIDHNHKTMKFRGILGTGCNAAMGQAGDDPKVLRKLAAYLEEKR